MNIFKKIYKFFKTSYRLKDIICSLPDDNTLEIKSSKSPSTQRIKTFIDAVDELLERSLNGDMKAKKIVDEYAERDETGNYKFLDEAKTNIQIKPNCIKEAEQKTIELQELEIELPKITFTLSEFENIELSPEDISGIIDFIEEEAE